MSASSSSSSGEEDDGTDAYVKGGYPIRSGDPLAGGRYVGPWMLGWGPLPPGWIAYDNRESAKAAHKRPRSHKKSSGNTSKNRHATESRNKEDRLMEKKVKTLHSRCSIKSLKSLLDGLDITENQKRLLNATPFGLFFEDLPDIVMEIGMLDVLVGVWDSDKNAFKIAGEDVAFTIEDVVCITGLRNCGERVEFSSTQSKAPVHVKLFPKEKLLRKTIAEKIRTSRRDGTDDETFVKLLILFLFNCLFFSPSNYKLNDKFAHYVSDLRTLQTWNWAEAIYRYFVNQLNYVNGNMGNRDAGDDEQNVGYLGGFALLILVWFWEHTKLKEPIHADKFPRLKRWKHESYRSRVEFLKVFDNLKQDEVVTHLILSEHEKELVCPEIDFCRNNGVKEDIGRSLCEGKFVDDPTVKMLEESTEASVEEGMESAPRIIDPSVLEKLKQLDRVVVEQTQVIEVYKQDYLGTIFDLMSRVNGLETRVVDLEMENKELRAKLGFEESLEPKEFGQNCRSDEEVVEASAACVIWSPRTLDVEKNSGFQSSNGGSNISVKYTNSTRGSRSSGSHDEKIPRR